jgi:hypothetical protein
VPGVVTPQETRAFNAGLDAALEAVKNGDHRKGRDWVPGSLWDNLTREIGNAILRLKRPEP